MLIALLFCLKIIKSNTNDISFPFYESHGSISHSMWHVKSVQFPICLIETSKKLEILGHLGSLWYEFVYEQF